MPLISLGLSYDTTFVKRLFKIINPEKFKTDQELINNHMTLKEFTQIFKRDLISQLITEKVIS